MRFKYPGTMRGLGLIFGFGLLFSAPLSFAAGPDRFASPSSVPHSKPQDPTVKSTISEQQSYLMEPTLSIFHPPEGDSASPASTASWLLSRDVLVEGRITSVKDKVVRDNGYPEHAFEFQVEPTFFLLKNQEASAPTLRVLFSSHGSDCGTNSPGLIYAKKDATGSYWGNCFPLSGDVSTVKRRVNLLYYSSDIQSRSEPIPYKDLLGILFRQAVHKLADPSGALAGWHQNTVIEIQGTNSGDYAGRAIWATAPNPAVFPVVATFKADCKSSLSPGDMIGVWNTRISWDDRISSNSLNLPKHCPRDFGLQGEARQLGPALFGVVDALVREIAGSPRT